MSAPTADRALLELAAKAGGIEPSMLMASDFRRAWNPLTDDGDALRLAVRLGITPLFGYPSVAVCPFSRGVDDHPDPFTATRRAIVRAAAAIGEAMP